MSRLDSVIRRLQAQRSLLNQATAMIAELPGPLLELGLGNGRTYDHLREKCPTREIFVFEREVQAHPACIPDDDHLLLGDIRETIASAGTRIGAPAAMAHCDIGTGDQAANAELARWLGPVLAPLMAPGALVLADQAFHVDRFQQLPLPDDVPPGRYHFYRVS